MAKIIRTRQHEVYTQDHDYDDGVVYEQAPMARVMPQRARFVEMDDQVGPARYAQTVHSTNDRNVVLPNPGHGGGRAERVADQIRAETGFNVPPIVVVGGTAALAAFCMHTYAAELSEVIKYVAVAGAGALAWLYNRSRKVQR